MSLRPVSLIFTQPTPILSPELPLEVWEVNTDSNCTFEIEPSGKLIRKDRMNGTRWFSPHLTGSFTIFNLPRHSTTEHLYTVYMVNGLATVIDRATCKASSPILTMKWRWVLDELDLDHDAVAKCRTYVGCLDVIRQAENDPGFRTGNQQLDAMLGMALCRPHLLSSINPRHALELLEDYQLRAISGWHKAH